MPDDLKKRTRDRKRISIKEDYEVEYWTEQLGVSRQELERAVKAVGNNADAVVEHLRSHKGR